jgi:hypothetical protein
MDPLDPAGVEDFPRDAGMGGSVLPITPLPPTPGTDEPEITP